MPEITLTFAEMWQGHIIGITRQFHNMKDGNVHKNNFKGDYAAEISNHIVGAMGEQALAKHLGVFWSGGALGSFKEKDVASKYQVKTTLRMYGVLLVQKGSPPNDPFILVTAAPPQFFLKGWMYGREAMTPEFWKDPSGNDRWCYCVPQEKLLPIAELPRW